MGHGANVKLAGPNLALSRLAYWVQEHAARHVGASGGKPVELWHLLTDCFPRDGTTGLSEFGAPSTCPDPDPKPKPKPNPNPNPSPTPKPNPNPNQPYCASTTRAPCSTWTMVRRGYP